MVGALIFILMERILARGVINKVLVAELKLYRILAVIERNLGP